MIQPLLNVRAGGVQPRGPLSGAKGEAALGEITPLWIVKQQVYYGAVTGVFEGWRPRQNPEGDPTKPGAVYAAYLGGSGLGDEEPRVVLGREAFLSPREARKALRKRVVASLRATLAALEELDRLGDD